MRYPAIVAALALLSAIVTADAMAAGPNRGIQIVNNNYIINDNDNGDYDYRPYRYRGRGYDYGGYRDYGYRWDHFNSHDEAVARIQATHSPRRQTYHPRSFYNSPPVYGW